MGLDPYSQIAGLGLGLIGAVGKGFARAKANKDIRALMGQNPSYQVNPLAQERYGYAKALLNARMPGALAAERNIYGNQANTLAGLQRNATDASQLLATANAVQGQTNNAFGNLAENEAQDYQRRYGNYSGATEGLINEGDKVQQDLIRQYGDKVQMQGAINANRMNTWQDISNAGFGMADLGLAGGFKGLFGGGGNKYGPQQAPAANMPNFGIDQRGLGYALGNLPRAANSPF